MIPVSEPAIGDAETALVVEALAAGEISSSGRFVQEFEERWAAYCGRRYGVAVSNGTVALQLAVACLDLAPGDEIVMPTFTIMSCALAATSNGAIPRLVDADPRTWCMNADLVSDVIGARTRAIMPVHIYGHPVNMDPILDLADRHGLAVIEDAAEAHGAEYQSNRNGTAVWRRCGSFGGVSCFSFYANKLITTGEGGMLVTDDPAIADRARHLRNLAFGATHRFRHDQLGFNFRLTNMQAALGIPQIDRMNEIIARKRSVAAKYTQSLQDIPGLQLPYEETWARSVYWMYGVLLAPDIGHEAEALAKQLTEMGVETRPFFLGLHEQPVLQQKGWFANSSYPVAEGLSRRGLYLPSGLRLSEDQIDFVAGSIRQLLA